MSYRVTIEFAAVYELLLSLEAFLGRRHYSTFELGKGWAVRVRNHLSSEVLAEIEDLVRQPISFPAALLLWRCPNPETIDDFLDWAGSLSAGHLYEMMSPYVNSADRVLSANLGAEKERFIQVLRHWHELYFKTVDPEIIRGLGEEARVQSRLVGTSDPTALVENMTGGVCIEPEAGLEQIVLVPQYHYRPWNMFEALGRLMFIMYPADVIPPQSGEPSPTLLRLTRALGDESRLRILHFLSGGVHSFGEIVSFIKLAKSTVHHHLVALRAAGLVRVHVTPGATADRYSLRLEGLEKLDMRVREFLQTH